MTSDKRKRLRDLARKRQATPWGGYHSLAEYHCGVYECDWVSPYSKTAGNVDARIFVLLQDWASDDDLRGPLDREAAQLGYTPRWPTNRNLIRLLRDTFKVALDDVYATNLFPFIKPGDSGARIPAGDLIRAAREFALPQIQVVQPALVVCLGLVTFNAMQRVCGIAPSTPMATAIDSPFTFERTRVWCQAHTGARGQRNRNRADAHRVSVDWQRMKSDVTDWERVHKVVVHPFSERRW